MCTSVYTILLAIRSIIRSYRPGRKINGMCAIYPPPAFAVWSALLSIAASRLSESESRIEVPHPTRTEIVNSVVPDAFAHYEKARSYLPPQDSSPRGNSRVFFRFRSQGLFADAGASSGSGISCSRTGCFHHSPHLGGSLPCLM